MIEPRKDALIALLVWVGATLFWWGLAFAPTPASQPEWLDVARKVCFGTMENGLPNSGGWLALILGPLSFFIGILVTWPGQARAWTKNLWASGPIQKGFVASVVGAFLLLGFWTYEAVDRGLKVQNFDFRSGETGDLPETYPRTAKAARDFTLVDQEGESLNLSAFKGEVVLLTFAFAHCQTVCPTLVKDGLESVKSFADARLLVITLDPWRDTPKSLPLLAEKWGMPEGTHVLSGEVKAVLEVLDAYEVPYKRDEKTGDVAHPALVYVIDKEGLIAYTFNNAPVSWLVKALENVGSAKHPVSYRRPNRSSIQSSL